MENKVAAAFPDNSVIHLNTIQKISQETRLYVIFIIARSGSTWLMEMAQNSNILGTPQEWFNEGWIHTCEPALGCRPPVAIGTGDVDEYLRRTVADYRSQSGVMGLQLSPYQTECLCSMVERPRDICSLVQPFYLRRRNLVAQAISLYRSVRSEFFHSYQANPVLQSRLDAVEYNAAAIAGWCEHLVAGEVFFESTFRRLNLSPARFTYEDIIADPEDVLTWMNQTINPTSTTRVSANSKNLKTLRTEISEEWCHRFRTERADFLAQLEVRRPPFLIENFAAFRSHAPTSN
ncbi:LPS sulfotransferase NodH [Burkholderia sp. OK233]|nr:LPS sulfotransferase NodH [Burkholderia sp. OK233]